MKKQYHITIKPEYFYELTPDWRALHPDAQRRIRSEVFETLQLALELGKNIITTSEHIIIRPLLSGTKKLRVIRSIPAVFK